VCSDLARVRDGQVKHPVRSRYLQRLRQGSAVIDLQAASDAAV